MTLGDDAYQILELAAKRKFISVQELLRAVIIPEWVEENPPIQKSMIRIQDTKALYAVT